MLTLPRGFCATTATGPAAWAGVMQVIVLSELTRNPVAAVPPKVTPVEPISPDPDRVTPVPRRRARRQE